MTRSFEKVGVVGLGTMGAGIAEVFARAGLAVTGVEADPAALERGRGHLEGSTGRALAKGRLSEAGRAEILGRVTFTTSLEDLADADLVIEAIPEVMEFKRALFTDLDRICKPSAVLATNTSSLSVTEIAATTTRPGQVVGMHFFNPAPIMKLVEVIRTVATEDGLAGEVADLARRLGKTPVTVGDRAGFVVNRLLLTYLNHAATLLDGGLATRDDIDVAMKAGVGLPMGPFTLLDLIGLDTSYEVLCVLFQESRDRRHAPAPILRELVTAGLLGRKSGGGFYRGEEPGGPPADKPSVNSVAVLGEGAQELADRLSAAGFKSASTEDADVVVALSRTPVVELAAGLPHPERLVGLHLVGDKVAEVASTVLTSPEAARAVEGLVRIAGRTPVPCKDRAEFVVDALLYPYLNDAVRMYDSGYASVEDIDAAMRLGCGYPTGPFEMLDELGLETVRDGLRALYAEYREPSLAPAPLLDQLVTAGVRSIRDLP
ncbi:MULTISPECIES: 3-hydroxyacyl-CoA dehydrogenase family protein [Streptosporangium]|uniref:3-hydroxybutyryl-CoA dehydrogenase n=1 Tax=Streptosporangium brasiliense TaxID=47480 RepID=A0ABT9QX22_9ACTN|nr:3-hydroxyacyl-CoA dehydrogenase NAD-binding domain-containing protein [Streptosporangium brasiliense]MDP9860795.1 3-hydroxybutyryl-CoA dehydrogenase [Streptosporangium brasiliense]